MSRAPWFVLRLLRPFIREERRVEMEGDLLEAYEEWVRTLGRTRALLRLSREAVLLLVWQGGRGGHLSDFSHDVGFAVRRLSRSPWASLVIILVLGLGVGGNAAIFTIADALFLEPPPLISNPQELVGLRGAVDEFGYYPRAAGFSGWWDG